VIGLLHRWSIGRWNAGGGGRSLSLGFNPGPVEGGFALVTGNPGTGKSATLRILTLIAMLSHPECRAILGWRAAWRGRLDPRL
jgi:hypothetical protein